jgi:hypothetical protein
LLKVPEKSSTVRDSKCFMHFKVGV